MGTKSRSPMKQMIYHHDDEDGWGSAAAVQIKYPEAQTAQCSYGREPELVKGYDEVYVLDFSFNAEEMAQLAANNKRFIWIDHHESKIKQITTNYEGIRDASKSACQLSWEYCFPEKEMPLILQHIADEDIWKFLLKETKSFNKFLSARLDKGKEIEIIKNIIKTYTSKEYEQAYEQGKNIKRYQDHQVEEQEQRGVLRNIFGYKAKVYFSNINTSQLGHEALNRNKNIDMTVIIFLIENTKGELEYKYSLRSRENGVNVAELSAEYNGGGHPCAAGFVSKKLIL